MSAIGFEFLTKAVEKYANEFVYDVNVMTFSKEPKYIFEFQDPYQSIFSMHKEHLNVRYPPKNRLQKYNSYLCMEEQHLMNTFTPENQEHIELPLQLQISFEKVFFMYQKYTKESFKDHPFHEYAKRMVTCNSIGWIVVKITLLIYRNGGKLYVIPLIKNIFLKGKRNTKFTKKGMVTRKNKRAQ